MSNRLYERGQQLLCPRVLQGWLFLLVVLLAYMATGVHAKDEDNCIAVKCPANAWCIDGENNHTCKCDLGLQPPACEQPCKSGTFGEDCVFNCHCKDEAPCDPKHGKCPGECASGYRGDTCSTEAVVGGFFEDKSYMMIFAGIGAGIALIAIIAMTVVLVRKRHKEKSERDNLVVGKKGGYKESIHITVSSSSSDD